MKKILYITIAIVLLGALSACEAKDEGSKTLNNFALTNSELGLYPSSATPYTYDEDKHQNSVSMSATDYKFRIQTNNQSSILAVEIDNFPSTLNEKVTVKIISNIEEITSKTYTMSLVKESADRAWLWAENEKVGMIVATP